MNDATQNYSVADTVENSMKLADECLNKNMFSEAKELYEKCLKGAHKDEPHIMYGLARAEFCLNNFSTVKSILDEIIDKNPDYKKKQGPTYISINQNVEKIKIDVLLFCHLDQQK